MKKAIKLLLSISMALILVMLFTPNQVKSNANDQPFQFGNHNFDPIAPSTLDNSYVSYTNFRLNIANAQSTAQSILSNMIGKKIRIDTAEELYRFSVDVSYNPNQVYITGNPLEDIKLTTDKIAALLSLDYELGNDIDYSVMQSRQFIPIGYSFSSLDLSLKENKFTGSFDGRGFEISNLYFAGYNQLTTVEGTGEEAQDLAITPYYSMFTFNEGTIKNLGLINPTLEIKFEHEDLTKAATLVGKNEGVVDHVYVIDNRLSAMTAGIRMKAASGIGVSSYEAAGIVFDNTGSMTNAYYVSPVVVNASYITNFLVQPVLYTNSGTASNLYYDQTVYLQTINIGGQTFNVNGVTSLNQGKTTSQLKSNLSTGNWFYYAQDRYPSLMGLTKNSGSYLIYNAIDLIAFSKMMNYVTVRDSVPYRQSNYLVMNDIDMSIVSAGAYKTPEIEFSGKLTGNNTTNNYYIKNLGLTNGTAFNAYYAGLFSVLSGEVSYLTFSNASINITNSATYYSLPFYIGMVTGQLDGGKINNVSVDVNIQLGSTSIGEVSVGSLVGMASGEVTNVYAKGTINAGNHTFTTGQSINPIYSIGGLIGRTGSAKLTLYNGLNQTALIGISTTASVSTTPVSIRLGGVVGFIENTSTIKHMIGLVTNEATITPKNYLASSTVNQYVSGVIGLSSGNMNSLTNQFGLWTNDGLLDFTQRGLNNIYSAGIVVSNHNEASEYIFLYNNESYITSNYTNLTYTTVLLNLSSSGITLSQSKNSAEVDINANINYSGLYHSTQNAQTMLRFVENEGNIHYHPTTVSSETSIAGISISSNINYLNVTYKGVIDIYSMTSNSVIWVSGISRRLTSGYYMKNTLNNGTIYFSNITNSQNNYIAGLVNENLSGNLNNQDASSQPVATTGIINSMNYADILSTYDVSLYGLYGLGNTFAGGIATFNRGSIQNVGNLGNIKFANFSPFLGTSTVEFSTNTNTGGRTNLYRSGVILGGIVAAVTHGTSRIYDAVNSGDIIGLSSNFSRTGGVLAIALRVELQVGQVNSNIYDSTDTIRSSILSNSINYGNISAVTENIVLYDIDTTTQTVSYYTGTSGQSGGNSINISTRKSTQERIGVHSSSGGVIGYGLSVMRRMINHGTVSSTDVAGGIVGATFVDTSLTVSIDTAINYGKVRAVNHNQYSNISKINIEHTNIDDYFYAENDTFISPVTVSKIEMYPESKRGIGGIFGRLQRGQSQYMRSTGTGGSFDFIVNMDPKVDMIGRLDQVYNFTSSEMFFDFQGAKYYSAKYNDKTQAAFTGYEWFSTNQVSRTIVDQTVYKLQRYAYTFNGTTWTRTTQRYVERRTETRYTGSMYRRVAGSRSELTNQTRVINTNVTSGSWVTVSGSQVTVPTKNYPQYSTEIALNTTLPANIVTTHSTTTSNYTIASNYERYYTASNAVAVDYISEENIANMLPKYVYAANFEMRLDTTLLMNNQPITSYIYYAENGLLSDRFSESRPNGMYVLSSSSGSSFGSVLPSNINFTRLFPLNGMQPYNIDYENPIDRIPLDNDLVDKYYYLLQTRYNDKSALLQNNQYIAMSENNGSQTNLLNPSIDYNNRIITFTLSLDLIQSGQTSISYKLTNGLVPANALIAMRIGDYFGANPINYSTFQTLLEAEANKGIATNLAPVLTANLPNVPNGSSQTITLGYFTSYSEAAVYNASFINSIYTTDYQVRLNVLGKSSSLPQPYRYSIDGSTLATFTENQTFSTPVSQTLRLMFDDQSPYVLNTGVDIKQFIRMEFQNELVNPSDYGLTSVPVNGTNNGFEFTITLNENLSDGEYKVYYKYYFADIEKVITFTKASSTSNSIKSFSYFSSGTVNPVGLSFTSYVDFGFDLGFSNISFQTIVNTDPLLKPYKDDTSYQISFMDSFVLAPFARLISTTYNGMTYEGGYRVYQLLYTIQAESGATETYVHKIKERSIVKTNVYKNNNKVLFTNVFATREAVQTNFAIDFGINPLVADEHYNLFEDNPNAYFSISVTAVDRESVPMTPQDIKGITYTADSLLNIIMSNQTLPGYYTFSFEYIRDGNTILLSTQIIEKREGISAYLTDIQFSESATETDYADMYVANPDGSINQSSPYDPSIYFAGIDYDGSQNVVFNYRVDGQVSNTPLNEFMPFFLEFLPAGATIARKVYPLENPSISWTNEVDNTSSPALKAELQADFTIMPDTGLEPTELENVVITYRTTSENGQNVVYYHITVIDIVYNVSLIFDVYYDDNGTPVEAYNSELANKVVLINVKNFNTNVAVTTALAPTVADFPTFNSIGITNNSIYMYYVGNNSSYRYRYGRNISGFYGFTVYLPKDPNGFDYTYYITYNGDMLNDLSQYVPGTNGKYFYINGGTKNRTRRFEIHVVRTNQSIDNGWGLDDYKDSFRN